MKEFTINHNQDFIISEIYKCNPDVICFSCYIWNIDIIKEIVSTIKKVLPKVVIVLGGPEVSYDFNYYLKTDVDFIIMGEGEATIKELIEFLLGLHTKGLENINGLAYKDNDKIIVNSPRKNLDLNEIPFVYKEGFKDLENKIIYYETSRGCPFNCQYCLSSNDKQLRFLPLSRVYKELKFFLDENIKQVKFIDRTFNCNKKHAINIWKFLIENDNNITNFHFEISADLLNNEMIDLLKTAREGQIQFEVGIQSTNINTLTAIKRKTNLDKVFEKISFIDNNIHKHLDLIIGLPNEGYNSFKSSFNMVYKLKPDKLQIGFLKLLKGSGLREDAEKYGIIYKNVAPYEVLYTKDISFKEILKLKVLEEMVEIFYNSNKFFYTIKFVIEYFQTPFNFYISLAEYWENNNYHHISHSKMSLYEIMRNFLLNNLQHKIGEIENLLKFDMYTNENVKNLPLWAKNDKDNKVKEKIRDFYKKQENRKKHFEDLLKYDDKQLSRICHIECFEYNIISWLKNDITSILEKEDTYILFKYPVKSQNKFEFFKVSI